MGKQREMMGGVFQDSTILRKTEEEAGRLTDRERQRKTRRPVEVTVRDRHGKSLYADVSLCKLQLKFLCSIYCTCSL